MAQNNQAYLCNHKEWIDSNIHNQLYNSLIIYKMSKVSQNNDLSKLVN